MSRNPPDDSVLVIALPAYRFATRARKAAICYANSRPTTYLSLAGAGRTGRWDTPGSRVEGGVDIRQVRVGTISVRTSRMAQLRNLLWCYLPGFLRLVRGALLQPAGVVHVSNPSLLIIGLAHKWRYGSKCVLDVPERVGAVNARGSLASKFSRFEPQLLLKASRWVDVALCVVPSELVTLSRLGFDRIFLVRNVPLSEWRATYTPPPDRTGCLRLMIVGSVFEGRGFEMILEAIADLSPSELDQIRLAIVGPGRGDYIEGLRELSRRRGIETSISWLPPVSSSDVSAAYLTAHVGLVLYEGADPGNDGLSNKLLECVASGRPVLAGDLPENRAFVSENAVGWLSQMEVHALTSALREILAETNLSAISDHCREVGDQRLIWEREFEVVLSAVSSAG